GSSGRAAPDGLSGCMRKAARNMRCRAITRSPRPCGLISMRAALPRTARAGCSAPRAGQSRYAVRPRHEPVRRLVHDRRRAKAAGIATEIGCRTFRATGITAYLANGGALEHAQEMAAHESPRTTKLYDRTKERLTQDEVERIRL